MTLSDFFKLIRHYIKMVIIVPVVCAFVATAVVAAIPPTYIAKATLLTNGDIALAGGYAQNEASTFSKNGIEVSSTIDTAYRTITIKAEGSDYGGCIAAANATVLAAAEDCREANVQASISTNEAISADNASPSIWRTTLMALFADLFVAICLIVLIDILKTPIKSKSDIEAAADLPVIGTSPNRDRGERLLANIRFICDEPPSTIAVVPVGLTGSTLTCAELTSALEHSKVSVSRVQGNAHAEGFNHVSLPGIVTIIECAPLSEGVGAVYIAKEADITILCATEWRDSRKALAAIVEEFRFAKIKLGGVVFLTSRYPEKSLF